MTRLTKHLHNAAFTAVLTNPLHILPHIAYPLQRGLFDRISSLKYYDEYLLNENLLAPRLCKSGSLHQWDFSTEYNVYYKENIINPQYIQAIYVLLHKEPSLLLLSHVFHCVKYIHIYSFILKKWTQQFSKKTFYDRDNLQYSEDYCYNAIIYLTLMWAYMYINIICSYIHCSDCVYKSVFSCTNNDINCGWIIGGWPYSYTQIPSFELWVDDEASQSGKTRGGPRSVHN